MLIDTTVHENILAILNVYALNSYTDRIEFFNLIIELKFNNFVIILGDFNQINNPLVDRSPLLPTFNYRWDAFSGNKINHNLIDCVMSDNYSIKNMSYT